MVKPCARVQVDLAQRTVGHDRVCGRPLVLLVVADEVLDCRCDAVGLQAVDVGGSQDACDASLNVVQ